MPPQDWIAHLFALIPLRFNHADFRVVNRSYAFHSAVGRARDIDDDLVTQRQQRADGLHERIAECIAVTNEGESADFHASFPWVSANAVSAKAGRGKTQFGRTESRG